MRPGPTALSTFTPQCTQVSMPGNSAQGLKTTVISSDLGPPSANQKVFVFNVEQLTRFAAEVIHNTQVCNAIAAVVQQVREHGRDSRTPWYQSATETMEVGRRAGEDEEALRSALSCVIKHCQSLNGNERHTASGRTQSINGNNKVEPLQGRAIKRESLLPEQQEGPRANADERQWIISHGLPNKTSSPCGDISASNSCECVSRKPVRIFMDGVFDLMHAGHFNAIRQAALLGDELYVGISSDASVELAKGCRPIYSMEERIRMIKACKWVKKVIPNVDYTVSLATLDSTGCDFSAHGDDIVLDANGEDCYAEIRAANRLKTFRRTEGISTTHLMSKLLSASRRVPCDDELVYGEEGSRSAHQGQTAQGPSCTVEGDCPVEHQKAEHKEKVALISSHRLASFITPIRKRPASGRVVYTDGSFDMFHAGHVSFLEKVKSFGDYLVVGIYDDATVKKHDGMHHPVHTMLERALCVLAMHCVDEVVFGAPYVISDFILEDYNVNLVVRGDRLDNGEKYRLTERDHDLQNRKMFELVKSDTPFTYTIWQRVVEKSPELRQVLISRRATEEAFCKYFSENNLQRPLFT